MKMKKSGCYLVVFSLIVLIFASSVFGVFAVPEDESGATQETYSEPASDYSTEATYDSEPSYETEPTYETEQTRETEATTQATEATTQATEATTQAPTDTTAPKETYAVLDNNLEDLPEADTAPNPTAAMTSKKKNSDVTYGIFSWVCVVVGVLTVVIVILSNKSGYYGGSGKQRYDEGNRIIGKKRLLNDDYYTNRKFNDYQDRDNYR